MHFFTSPHLGWRDVQHLIAWSAKPYSLYMNEGWKTNAAGFKVNHRWVIKFHVSNPDSLQSVVQFHWTCPSLNLKICVTEGKCTKFVCVFTSLYSVPNMTLVVSDTSATLF